MSIPVLQHPKLASDEAPSFPEPRVIDERGRLPTRVGGWETASYPYRARIISRVDGARIHYTAGATSETTLGVAAYQTGHGAHEQFPAIAYHYLVEGDGSVHWCHNLDKRVWGSGQPGSNETDVHVCYTGNHQPNGLQLDGLKTALRHAQQTLGRKLSVKAHRDGYSTACPGPTWELWRVSVLP